MKHPRPKAPSELARLPRQIWLTRLGLLAERLSQAFWPLGSLALGVFGAVALGLASSLPLIWLNGLGLALLLFALVLAWRGLRRFRLPTRAEAVARLDATMPGRPLAALSDRQAIGETDPASQAVWAAHIARMTQRAAKARAPIPDVDQRNRDPFALRHLALSLAGMALIFGSSSRLTEIGTLTPPGAQALVAGPVWEGWVRPPAYTGKPAIYLNDVADEALELPQGSRVMLRFYGPPGALGVEESVSNAPSPYSKPKGKARSAVRSSPPNIMAASRSPAPTAALGKSRCCATCPRW